MYNILLTVAYELHGLRFAQCTLLTLHTEYVRENEVIEGQFLLPNKSEQAVCNALGSCSNGSSCIQQETTGNFQNDKHRGLIPLLHTDCVNYAKQKEAHHGAEQICAAVYYCNCCYTDD